MKPITIRCSSLPRAMVCAPSVLGDGINVKQRNEAGPEGSAGHEAMTAIVSGQEPDLDAIALKWGVKRAELGRLVWYGMKAWEQLAPSFAGGASEQQVVFADHRFPFGLIGHVDLVTAPAAVVHGADWKFGRLDHDYYHQLAGYTACIMSVYPEVETVVFAVVWCRDGQIETYTFTRQVIEGWKAHLADQVTKRHSEYVTGEHCAYCPRSHDCPAIRSAARRDAAVFLEDGALEKIQSSLGDLPAAELVNLFRRVKVIEALAKNARESIRNVVRVNGPQDAGDGTELAIVEQAGARVIDPGKAWETLSARLTQAELAQITEISASTVDEIVAKNAGRGNGAAAKRELAEALERANAVTQGRIEKMVTRRKAS